MKNNLEESTPFVSGTYQLGNMSMGTTLKCFMLYENLVAMTSAMIPYTMPNAISIVVAIAILLLFNFWSCPPFIDLKEKM